MEGGGTGWDRGGNHVIIKTTCPSGYHHNGFVATHALGHVRLLNAGTNEPKSAQQAKQGA